MARPRELPDADELATLRRKGWSYDKIAEKYGVTKQAVYLALRRSNLIEVERPRYEDEIPWEVKTEHAGKYEVGMLRLAARLDRGETLPGRKAEYVRSWLARLHEADAVVAYNSKVGFYYAPRRHGVDTGLIRKPSWLLERERTQAS